MICSDSYWLTLQPNVLIQNVRMEPMLAGGSKPREAAFGFGVHALACPPFNPAIENGQRPTFPRLPVRQKGGPIIPARPFV